MERIVRAITKIISSALFIVPSTLAHIVVLFIYGIHPILLSIVMIILITGVILYKRFV